MNTVERALILKSCKKKKQLNKMSLSLSVKGLKARGNVEDWLGKVEESMVSSLRKLAKASIADYESRAREEWVTLHPSQVHSRYTVHYVHLAIYCLAILYNQ